MDPLDVRLRRRHQHDTAAEAEALRPAGSEDDGRARLAESYGRPSGSAEYGLGGGRDPFEAPDLDESGDDGDEFSELEPEPDDSDTAPTPIASEADPNSGRHSSIPLDERGAR